jgi:hypothetical protein
MMKTLTTTRSTWMGHRKGKESLVKHQPTQMHSATEPKMRPTSR